MNLLTMGLYGVVSDRSKGDSSSTSNGSSLGNVGPTNVDDLVNALASQARSSSLVDAGPSYMSRYNDHYTPDEIISDNWLGDLAGGFFGSDMTTAQKQANAYNTAERINAQNFEHNEAVDARLWEQYVANNKYQWETQSMQNAGINPAMAYGGGSLVPTQATGAMAGSSPATSVNPGSPGDMFGALMSLVRMPLEMRAMNAQIEESHSRAKLNNANAYGVGLNNQITEATLQEVIDKAMLDNEDLRASIDLKKKQAKTEEERAGLVAAEKLLTNLDREQKAELFPLLKEAQRLTNEYQECENRYQEKRILSDLRTNEARIKQMVASALLSSEQAKYAGRMTLAQVIGTYLNESGVGKDVGDTILFGKSPIGWLIDNLWNALGEDAGNVDGTGGATSVPGGNSRSDGYGNGAPPTVGSR